MLEKSSDPPFEIPSIDQKNEDITDNSTITFTLERESQLFNFNFLDRNLNINNEINEENDQDSSPTIMSYNISSIPKDKLTLKEKTQLLFTFKKLILSSISYNNRSASLNLIIILLHLTMILTNVFSFFFDKKKLFGSNEQNKFDKFIIFKLVFANFIIAPVFIYSNIYLITSNKNKANDAIIKISKFILKNESNNNSTFNYELDKNLNLTVTKKNYIPLNHRELIKTENDDLILYIICLYLNSDNEIELPCKKMISSSDMSIIEDISSFISSQIKIKLDKFLKKCLLPALVSLIFFMMFQKKDKYFFISGFVIIVSVLGFIYSYDNKLMRTLKKSVINHINEINKGYCNSGKFVCFTNRLLMIVNLNEKGRKTSLKQLNKYINKIVNN